MWLFKVTKFHFCIAEWGRSKHLGIDLTEIPTFPRLQRIEVIYEHITTELCFNETSTYKSPQYNEQYSSPQL